MCVGVSVRLSHRVSVEVLSDVCTAAGSQIQDRAVVIQGVIEADACRGQGFADLREGCHGGCHWRCHLMRPRVGFCGLKSFLQKFSFLFGYVLYLYFGLFLAQKYIYRRRCIL